MLKTLRDLLATGTPEAPALSAPGRKPLTHAALRALIDRTLAAASVRNDRVAIVLPNGPEMAACFVACASAVASAPLNPAYRADEFEFYLTDLRAKALIVERGSTSPAWRCRTQAGCAHRRPDGRRAGRRRRFTLASQAGSSLTTAGTAQADDVSMVLHTSGTTSRPKIVPLSSATSAPRRATSARRCASCPGPRPEHHAAVPHPRPDRRRCSRRSRPDRQVFCTPGFNALKFFAWMDEARPTWYTAVPTMHQAILARAGKNREDHRRRPLRFIRSSSSSMPPQVMRELERSSAHR
jgi:oxalate---CoA ligase